MSIPGAGSYIRLRNQKDDDWGRKFTFNQIMWFPVVVQSFETDDSRFAGSDQKRIGTFLKIMVHDYIRNIDGFFNTGSEELAKKFRSISMQMSSSGVSDRKFSCFFYKKMTEKGNIVFTMGDINDFQMGAIKSGVSESEYISMLLSKRLINEEEAKLMPVAGLQR